MSFRQIADPAPAFRIAYRETGHARRTRRRPREPQQNLDCRGLAGAVGAEETEEFALLDREVDAVERGDVPPQRGAVHLPETGDLNDRHGVTLYVGAWCGFPEPSSENRCRCPKNARR